MCCKSLFYTHHQNHPTTHFHCLDNCALTHLHTIQIFLHLNIPHQHPYSLIYIFYPETPTVFLIHNRYNHAIKYAHYPDNPSFSPAPSRYTHTHMPLKYAHPHTYSTQQNPNSHSPSSTQIGQFTYPTTTLPFPSKIHLNISHVHLTHKQQHSPLHTHNLYIHTHTHILLRLNTQLKYFT